MTSDGYPVLDDRGQEIVIPQDAREINLSADGVLSNGDEQIARLGIVTFENEYALRNASHGLYISDQEPIPVEEPNVQQGMLERANVEPVLEISHMMSLLRGFEAAQRLVQTDHDNQRKAIDRIMRQA